MSKWWTLTDGLDDTPLLDQLDDDQRQWLSEYLGFADPQERADNEEREALDKYQGRLNDHD